MKSNNVMAGILICGSIFFLDAKDIKKNMPKSTNAPADIELIAETPDTTDHYYQYLKATYQHAGGKGMQSLETYQRLLKYQPSPQAYNGFVQLLFDAGQFKTIIKLYESREKVFNEAFKDNVLIKLIVAQSYLNTDMDTQAEKIFSELAQAHPDNEQVAYFATIAFLKNNQLDKANDFVDKCLQNQALRARHFLFHFLKSKILIQQNKNQEALVQIEKSLELYPRFDRGLLFKAILLEQMGKVNDAISGYKKFLDMVGRDAVVEKQLVQLLFSQQRFAEAKNYLKKLKVASPEYFFDLALMEYRSGNEKAALGHLDKAIKMSSKFHKARLLKIEILLQSKKFNQILTVMRDWIIDQGEDTAVLHTLLLLRKTPIPAQSIIKMLQGVEKKKPHVNMYAALADLFLEAKNYKQALAYYQKILNQTKHDELKSTVLFHMGYIYHITNQPQKLEHVLNEAIHHEPVYPSAYNLLAYHYAKMNKNLQQALDLSDKALAAAPQCYYYLDTKGYILLKLGKREAAQEVLTQAFNLAPDDMIIKNHLAQAQKGN
jgi:tetratricopeptide (TPR) repeat protein